MKKIKKFVAVILLSLTLFNAIFNSYTMTVSATDVGMTMTVLDSMLSLFGVTIGIGNQAAHITDVSIWSEVMDAASAGETYTMSNYGTVDFSDSESVQKWLTWCNDYNDYSLGKYEGDTVWDNTVNKVMKGVDSVSYVVSGTVGSNAMNDSISSLVGKLATDSGKTLEEIADMCGVCSGSESGTISWDRWSAFSAITSAIVMSNADKFVDIVSSFTVPEETVYQGFSDAFLNDIGFDRTGRYEVFWNTDRNSYYHVMGYYKNYKVCYFSNVIEEDYPRCMLYDGTQYIMHYYNGSLVSYNLFLYNPETGKSSSCPSISSGVFACPVFANRDDAYAYYKHGDASGIKNLVDGAAYPTFKQEVPAISGTIADSLQGLIKAYPDVSDFVNTIPTIIDAVAPLPGSVDYPKVVADTIADTAGIDTSDKSESSSTGYMGILEKILSAIKFFNNPIEAILTKWNILLDLLADIKVLWEEFVSSFPVEGEATNPNGSIDSNDSSGSSGFINILNGLIMLISIFFILLRIFLHLLEFIINIFKIPADPGFITGDFAIGFEYIKSVQLTPLTISVYDFLMGLVHILVLFSVVKVLKKHIDRIHL